MRRPSSLSVFIRESNSADCSSTEHGGRAGTISSLLQLILQETKGDLGQLPLRRLRKIRTLMQRRSENDASRSRRNVAHHYDLDGRLLRLFLDSDRQYSCAYFDHPDASLEEAQLAKKRHISAKLMVDPDSEY